MPCNNYCIEYLINEKNKKFTVLKKNIPPGQLRKESMGIQGIEVM